MPNKSYLQTPASLLNSKCIFVIGHKCGKFNPTVCFHSHPQARLSQFLIRYIFRQISVYPAIGEAFWMSSSAPKCSRISTKGVRDWSRKFVVLTLSSGINFPLGIISPKTGFPNLVRAIPRRERVLFASSTT